MKYRSILTLIIALVIASGVYENLHAQDNTQAQTQAIQAYNSALELANAGNLLEAVSMYEEAIELSAACEAECSEIVDLSTNQIPLIYWRRAANAYNQFNSQKTLDNINTTIINFEEAITAGQEYGNDQVVAQGQGAMHQLHYAKSIVQFNNENYQGALESLDTAVQLDPTYTLGYYQRAIVLINNGSSLQDVTAAFDRAIEVGEQAGDTQNVQRARTRLAQELVFRAVELKENNQRTEAFSLLQQAHGYAPNSVDVNYRLAEVQNLRGNFSEAQTYATRALELDNGGAAVLARIYFELGTAYQGQGESTIPQACSAFENAAYGDFRDPAMHKMEFELECQDI